MGELNGFDEFWTVYPRRVGKLAAIKAYKRALKLTTPEVLLSAAKKYAHARAGQDETYTAHAATWLNGGKWDAYETDLTRPATPTAPAKQPKPEPQVSPEEQARVKSKLAELSNVLRATASTMTAPTRPKFNRYSDAELRSKYGSGK